MKKIFFKNISGEILEFAIILIAFYFLFFPIKVDGSSMEKTLINGDRIMVCRAAAMAGLYGRDDIVIIKYQSEKESFDIIKRVTAVEGDTVEYKDGKVYINGEIKEGYFTSNEDMIFTVDKGFIFVLGDNAEKSTDSRAFGQVDRSRVKAVALLRLYPFNSIKILL